MFFSFFVFKLFYSHTPRFSTLHLWQGSTIRSPVVKKLYHKLVLSLRSESQHSDFFLSNPSSKCLSNDPWPERSSRLLVTRPPSWANHWHRWDIIYPSDFNLNHIMEGTVSW